MANYQFKKSPSSTAEIEELKERLLDDECYFPIQSANLEQLTFKTKGEIMANDTLKNYYDFEAMRQEIDSVLTDDCKVLSTNWNYHGKQFESLCIVKDGEGIVYDNILSNILFFKKRAVKPSDNEKNRKKARMVVQYMKARKKETGGGNSGGITIGGGSTGGGNIGGGNIGGGGIGGAASVENYINENVISYELSTSRNKVLGELIFTHTVVAYKENGNFVFSTDYSDIEVSLHKSGYYHKDKHYIERRYGIDGRCTVVFFGAISLQPFTCTFEWNGEHFKTEGELPPSKSGCKESESSITEHSTGWRRV